MPSSSSVSKLVGLVPLFLLTLTAHITLAQKLPNLLPFPNATGMLKTYNAGRGPIDLTGPFFQPLGTNGRSCASCATGRPRVGPSPQTR